MGATISEDCNQDGATPAASFVPAMIGDSAARDLTGEWLAAGKRSEARDITQGFICRLRRRRDALSGR
jgi:hypothetical protein